MATLGIILSILAGVVLAIACGRAEKVDKRLWGALWGLFVAAALLDLGVATRTVTPERPDKVSVFLNFPKGE